MMESITRFNGPPPYSKTERSTLVTLLKCSNECGSQYKELFFFTTRKFSTVVQLDKLGIDFYRWTLMDLQSVDYCILELQKVIFSVTVYYVFVLNPTEVRRILIDNSVLDT